jgi:hypothetical protein
MARFPDEDDAEPVEDGAEPFEVEDSRLSGTVKAPAALSLSLFAAHQTKTPGRNHPLPGGAFFRVRSPRLRPVPARALQLRLGGARLAGRHDDVLAPAVICRGGRAEGAALWNAKLCYPRTEARQHLKGRSRGSAEASLFGVAQFTPALHFLKLNLPGRSAGADNSAFNVSHLDKERRHFPLHS